LIFHKVFGHRISLTQFFIGVAMEWWVLAVDLGVPVIMGIALYLTLRK
jgi:hypothetical protein